MLIEETKINNCLIIKPKVHYDFRGEYVETFNEKKYKKILPSDVNFVQDDFSVSFKNVLRGMHGDTKTWKLIQCLHGEILLAVYDIRDNSGTKDNWQLFPLNEKNRWQVLVPANCLNGHLCLSDKCIFSYKQSEYYSGPKDQFSVKWNTLGIDWPINNPILSERDKH